MAVTIPSHAVAVWLREAAAGMTPPAVLRPEAFAYDPGGTQRTLFQAHAAGRAQCLCGKADADDGEVRRLVIRQRGDLCYLARYPKTQLEHAEDCRWSLTVDVAGRPGDDGEVEELHVTLPVGRKVARRRAKSTEEDSAAGAGGGQGLSQPATRRTTFEGLLRWLLEEAGLTWWHRGFHNTRSDAVAVRRIRSEAEKAVWGRRTLGSALVLAPAGTWPREIWGYLKAENTTTLGRALRQGSRVLVLAEVLGAPTPIEKTPRILRFPVAREPFPIGVVPIAEAPFIAKLKDRFKVEWAALTEGWDHGRVWLLGVGDVRPERRAEGMAGPDKPSPVVMLQDAGLVLMHRRWFPVDNAFELQLVDRLVREGRSFRKPIRFGAAAGTLPGLELHDVGERPLPMEIFAVTEDPLLSVMVAKAMRYDLTLGPGGWWRWDALLHGSPPPIPAPRAAR